MTEIFFGERHGVQPERFAVQVRKRARVRFERENELIRAQRLTALAVRLVAAFAAVFAVAEQGMAGGSELCAYLVCAPGYEPALL